jgi:O-antigen chain-terminating methyltransferase
MSLGFYRAFEDRFRGSRELIKSRLDVYRGFLEPLLEVYPEAKALDLGCGRGEWLELLTEIGFVAEGVDLDEGMLDACRKLDLNVAKEDALEYMRGIPDESHAVVSAFHLVEHMPFEDLHVLVKEALRILRPAGLLVLETPNPENIVVGSCNFYLDPTHERPIPSRLLAFLPEYHGFQQIKILGLQESKEDNQSLLSVLNGVSADYAVIAQKTASNKLLSISKDAFKAEYGLTLAQQAETYAKQERERITALTARAERSEEGVKRAELGAQRAEETSRKVEERVRQLEERAQQQSDERASEAEESASQADAREQQAQIRAAELNTLILAIHASRSWGITRPIRWLERKLKSEVKNLAAPATSIDEIVPKNIVVEEKLTEKDLTKSASDIYQELKAAIDKKGEDKK